MFFKLNGPVLTQNSKNVLLFTKQVRGQLSSMIAHLLSVPVDHNSNPGGGEKISPFVLESQSHDWCLPLKGLDNFSTLKFPCKQSWVELTAPPNTQSWDTLYLFWPVLILWLTSVCFVFYFIFQCDWTGWKIDSKCWVRKVLWMVLK